MSDTLPLFRLTHLIALSLLALFLVACGGSAQPENTPTMEIAAATTCVHATRPWPRQSPSKRRAPAASRPRTRRPRAAG